MTRGLYTAAMGMMTSQVKADVISQNIANANTSGYRKDETITRSFPGMVISRLNALGATPIGGMGTGSVIAGTYTSFEEGAVQETGDPYSLALHGNVFFTVRDRQGQTYYTRNGDFVLNSDGQLVTNTGEAVLGEIGGQEAEIFVQGGSLTVAKDGTLSGAVDGQGQTVERLLLYSKPEDAVWTKTGNSLFDGFVNDPVEGYTVQQCASENSNVNAVEEMVRLIEASRAYEANARVIQATDATLDKVVNSVGSV